MLSASAAATGVEAAVEVVLPAAPQAEDYFRRATNFTVAAFAASTFFRERLLVPRLEALDLYRYTPLSPSSTLVPSRACTHLPQPCSASAYWRCTPRGLLGLYR